MVERPNQNGFEAGEGRGGMFCLNEENLAQLVDGTASESRLARWREHLGVCDSCRKKAASLAILVWDTNASSRAAAPEALKIRVEKALESGLQSNPGPTLFFLKKAAAPAAAASLAIVLFAGYQNVRMPGPSSPNIAGRPTASVPRVDPQVSDRPAAETIEDARTESEPAPAALAAAPKATPTAIQVADGRPSKPRVEGGPSVDGTEAKAAETSRPDRIAPIAFQKATLTRDIYLAMRRLESNQIAEAASLKSWTPLLTQTLNEELLKDLAGIEIAPSLLAYVKSGRPIDPEILAHVQQGKLYLFSAADLPALGETGYRLAGERVPQPDGLRVNQTGSTPLR